MAEILSIGELLDLGGSASTAGLIPYSALEYSAQKITAISGTAIGGNVDSATVTAIVNSSVSSKVDQSAFDQCCSSMSSVVSSLETSVTSMSSVVSGLTGDYLEKTASSMFQPSGDYAYSSSLSSYLPGSASSQFAPSGDYAYNSALSAYQPSGDYAFNSSVSSKLDESAFTAYTATATQGHTYTGVDPIVVDNTADRISLSATSVHLDSSMTSYTSGGSGFIGVNANIEGFVKTSELSGYIPTSESAKYQLTANMSGYIPTSESAKYYPMSGNPSSFVQLVNMSGWIPTSESAKYQLTADMSSYATTAQLANKLDTSAQAVSAVQMLNNDVRYINGKDINAAKASLASSANKYIYQRDNLGYLSSEDISALRNSALDLYSAKLDASANLVSSLGTRTEGVYTYVDDINGLRIYANMAYSAKTADFANTAGYCKSAFIDTGTYVPFSAFALESSVSSKLDASASSDFLAASASSDFMAASASSDFYGTGNPSGFTNYLPNFGYNADDEISSIDGSAVAGGLDYTSPSGTISIDNIGGTIENTNSAIRVDEHVIAAQHVSSYSASAESEYFYIWGNPVLSSLGITGETELTFSGISSQGLVNLENTTGQLTVDYYRNGAWTFSGMTATAYLTSLSSTAFRLEPCDIVSFNFSCDFDAGYPWGLSASASIDVPAQTASSTSVNAMAWADMSNVTAWQSLTAWAVSQGWTP